ncbi:MAG: ribosome recycling factor [Bacilli bacterium]|nr:ribosome recycling factor [Bacilli bacterium]
MEFDIIDTELKMDKAIENLESRLTTIRAGRANPAMLNGIMVEAYGVLNPINALANISVVDARQLFIKPFDKSTMKDIEKAIFEANLGINPTNNGEVVILTVPELTEDKRRDYVKQAKTIGEEAKIALRNIRQDANNVIKKMELPEDQEKANLEDVQELINKYNAKVDQIMKDKENELMAI